MKERKPMANDIKDAEGRKPYQKPELHVVSLTADEVLAKGCKTATGGPPPTGLGCKLGGCSQRGS
jgi:hypothetical protein